MFFVFFFFELLYVDYRVFVCLLIVCFMFVIGLFLSAVFLILATRLRLVLCLGLFGYKRHHHKSITLDALVDAACVFKGIKSAGI